MPISRKRAIGLTGLSIAALAAASGAPISQAAASTQNSNTIALCQLNLKQGTVFFENQQGNNNCQDQTGNSQ